MEKKKYTITAALPYANGPLHLGHVAGVYLPADIFVRFLRHQNHDVLFVCGSDEHGAAITLRAKKEGVSPKEIVDKYNEILKKSFNDFGISFDIYHRTSEKNHHETAQDFFLKLQENNAFIQKESEQYYDEDYKQFLADRYIVGTCPKCGNDGAYGDQCEKCGTSLSPTELINPKSTLSGKSPVLKQTKHWYLPMNEHEEWLKQWIKEGTLDGKQLHDPKLWRNQVVGQCMSWIDGGLHPRAMTRDLDWGVKVPVDGADGKVLYVWLDAPIGYISATKAWSEANNKKWQDYWTGDRKLIHFIGKDNIVFHAIIFPIILKAHGDLVLPENVPASEFLNLEGDKFSTSRNWAVWLHEYLERHPEKEDELKYTLTAIAPESKDAEFTWVEFQNRVNNELADVLGNFVNRALVLTNKYYDGVVPARGVLNEVDHELIDKLADFPNKIADLMYKYKIREAQSEVMNLARLGNKYLAEQEPWKLFKTDKERVKTIMNLAVQIVGNLSVLLDPFLPKTANKLRTFLNISDFNWGMAGAVEIISKGHKINKPDILFEKISDEFVLAEQSLLAQSNNAENIAVEPQKNDITFDEFSANDFRIGEIISAEKVKKANKLLKLEVDTGIDVRTIVSGIAEHYAPEEIIGKKVTVLVNLAPRKIRGVESQGMILMAEDADGKLCFIQPEKSFVNGSVVR